MNYKVVVYKCNSKYLWLHGTKRPPKCPQCGAVQKSVTLWCSSCGVKLEVIPLAGLKKRCNHCAIHQAQKITITCKQKRENLEPTGETLKEKDERELKAWFTELQVRFGPPLQGEHKQANG